jgi:hypothetical protein
MKLPLPVVALLLSTFLSSLAHAQEAAVPAQENYAYLQRMNVPAPVIQCVAAFDRWVASAHKYDAFIVPDRRVLSAKVDSDATVLNGVNPVPVDQVIAMRAFAKVHGTSQWTRVASQCGMLDGHVVGVTLTTLSPNVRPAIVR